MDQKTLDIGRALKIGVDAVAELKALKTKGDFRWLIEAPGPKYLGRTSSMPGGVRRG